MSNLASRAPHTIAIDSAIVLRSRLQSILPKQSIAALRLLAALVLSLSTVFLRFPVPQPVLWSIPPHYRHLWSIPPHYRHVLWECHAIAHVPLYLGPEHAAGSPRGQAFEKCGRKMCALRGVCCWCHHQIDHVAQRPCEDVVLAQRCNHRLGRT